MRRLPLVGPLERLVYLRSQETFSLLAAEELAATAHLTRERYFRRGTSLLTEGTPVSSVYFLVDGSVRARRKGGSIRVVEPPEALGMLSVLAGLGGPEAVADSDVTALSLPADALFELLEEEPNFRDAVLRDLARELATARRADPAIAYAASPKASRRGRRSSSEQLDLVERLVCLRRVAAFAQASLESVAELSRRCEEVRLGPGELLWELDAEAQAGVVIVHGLAECTPPNGARFEVGSGFGLGLVEAMGGVPHGYGCRTVTDLVGLRLGVGSLLDVLEDHTLLGRTLLGHLSRRLMVLYERRANPERGQRARPRRFFG